MATITLRTEGAGVRPQFGTRERIDRDAAVCLDRDFGHVRARELNERSTRAWELVWDAATFGQRMLLEQAFDDSLGGVLALNFTPPRDVDANAIEVLLVDDTFEAERVGPTRWSMRAVVEEAH